jgi:hypothetical protein
MPSPQSTSVECWDFSPTEEEMIDIKKKSDDFQIPQNFTATHASFVNQRLPSTLRQ